MTVALKQQEKVEQSEPKINHNHLLNRIQHGPPLFFSEGEMNFHQVRHLGRSRNEKLIKSD